ncbi:DUF6205 family protein [Micromonospora arborensis]|uniref:DUF6205 family protein n=1 Tax=Micromonospora arborensis TaxID=2116518 RepID=UPI0037180805
MGYDTRVTGAILISPPIPYAVLAGSRFLGWPYRRFVDKDCVLRVVEQVPEGGDGSLVRRVADAIVPAVQGPYSAHRLVDDVQDVLRIYGAERTFTGRLTCLGEEAGDIWRLEIHEGQAVRVEPRLVWPDGTEGLTP